MMVEPQKPFGRHLAKRYKAAAEHPSYIKESRTPIPLTRLAECIDRSARSKALLGLVRLFGGHLQMPYITLYLENWHRPHKRVTILVFMT